MKLVNHPYYIAKRKKGICVACRCKKLSMNGGKMRFCAKHHKRWQKQNNPIRYYYDLLGSSAKRRYKDFNLTIEEFRRFCEQTKLIELKLKEPYIHSIDRIDPYKGYSIDNIQVLTVSDNSKKRWEDEFSAPSEDCPF